MYNGYLLFISQENVEIIEKKKKLEREKALEYALTTQWRKSGFEEKKANYNIQLKDILQVLKKRDFFVG